MDKVSYFFPWRKYFAPELDASGPESFPPGFYTHFYSPTVENFDSVFLTKVDQLGLNFENFYYFARELDALVPEVSLQDFLHILDDPQPKISIRSF